jgi:hypothetical protein
MKKSLVEDKLGTKRGDANLDAGKEKNNTS